MTFTKSGAVLWLLSLLKASASVIQRRDYPYDQIRFMHCSKVGVEDDHSHLEVGFYKWAPQPGNQGQIYDELIFTLHREGGWNYGFKDTIPTNGKQAVVDINAYPSYKEAFKTWVGTITYNGNGFNCFVDDKHAVHTLNHAGQCYTDIYCTHQTATQLEIFASEKTVTLQQRKSFTHTDVLKFLDNQIHGGQCDQTFVDVAGGAKAKATCFGDPKSVDSLRKVLQGPLTTYPSAFKTQTVEECTNVCRPCTPREPGCQNCEQVCHDETRVTMPAFFTLQLTNYAPPNAPTANNPGPQAQLTASLNRFDGEDSVLCGTLKLAAGLGALIAPVAAFFGAANLAVSASCGCGDIANCF